LVKRKIVHSLQHQKLKSIKSIHREIEYITIKIVLNRIWQTIPSSEARGLKINIHNLVSAPISYFVNMCDRGSHIFKQIQTIVPTIIYSVLLKAIHKSVF